MTSLWYSVLLYCRSGVYPVVQQVVDIARGEHGRFRLFLFVSRHIKKNTSSLRHKLPIHIAMRPSLRNARWEALYTEKAASCRSASEGHVAPYKRVE